MLIRDRFTKRCSGFVVFSCSLLMRSPPTPGSTDDDDCRYTGCGTVGTKSQTLLCVRLPDCGAGIGRVTKHLLLERFDSVDIVEQSPRLLRAAPKYVGRERDRTTCVCVGLQVRTMHSVESLCPTPRILG